MRSHRLNTFVKKLFNKVTRTQELSDSQGCFDISHTFSFITTNLKLLISSGR